MSQANFRVVQSNVKGEDRGFYLFGILPFVTPSHGDAMSDLRAQSNMTGRATALANVTEDRSTVYLLLFSIPRVTITADVIEFVDDDDQPARSATAAPSQLRPTPGAADRAGTAAPVAPVPIPVATTPAAAPSESGVTREFCVDATDDLNKNRGSAHPLRVYFFQLSSTESFADADKRRLTTAAPDVPGVLGAPLEHTVYPGSKITLQVVQEAGARYLGTVAQYDKLDGSGRGTRSMQDASCIRLGANSIESP